MAEAGKGKGSDRPREKQQWTSWWSWLVEGIPTLAQLLNLLEPYSLTSAHHQLESGIWPVVGPTANMRATQNVISGLGLKVPTSFMLSHIKSNSPFTHLDSIGTLLGPLRFWICLHFLRPSCFFFASRCHSGRFQRRSFGVHSECALATWDLWSFVWQG